MAPMKKTHLNKILIPLVFGIWGWVIWTYLGPSLLSEEGSPATSNTISLNVSQKIDVDTFSLDLSYRDPFLNKTKKQTFPVSGLTKPPTPINSTPVIQRIGRKQSPPPLKYKGNIQGSGDAPIQTGIIEWQGKTLTVSVQDSMNGLKVLAFTPSHIKVAYADTVWVISK